MIKTARNKSRLFFKENPYVPKDRAKARAVANLANSAGCKLIGPNTNHERDPFISGAKNMVAISKSMIIP